MDSIKAAIIKVAAVIGGILTAILAIFLIFRGSDDKKVELQINDAKLEGKQEEVQKQVDADKAKLEKIEKEGVPNLTPNEVEDYWKKNLK